MSTHADASPLTAPFKRRRIAFDRGVWFHGEDVVRPLTLFC
jgi:hypothetical protein